MQCSNSCASAVRHPQHYRHRSPRAYRAPSTSDSPPHPAGEYEEAAPGHAAHAHPDDRGSARAARRDLSDHAAGRRPAPRSQSARRVLAASAASPGGGRATLSAYPRPAAIVPWEYTAAAAAATAATAAAAGQLHPRELGPAGRHIDRDLAAAAAAAAADAAIPDLVDAPPPRRDGRRSAAMVPGRA
jgi:hypothetical protein